MEGEKEMYNQTDFQHFYFFPPHLWKIFPARAETNPVIMESLRASVNMAACPTCDLHQCFVTKSLFFGAWISVWYSGSSATKAMLCFIQSWAARDLCQIWGGIECLLPGSSCGLQHPPPPPLLLVSTIYSGFVFPAPDNSPSSCPSQGGPCLLPGSWPLCIWSDRPHRPSNPQCLLLH